jgi:PqqA peptide cyclase
MKYIPRFLTAELTYRCPLQCFYCSNPTNLAKFNKELKTDTWKSIFDQAKKLGVVQLGLTGGEPLVRKDIFELVKHSSNIGLYSNLITSAVGLNEKKMEKLKYNGLNSIQISFQAENRELNNKISGLNSYDHKINMISKIKNYDFPLTLNVVLHKLNLDNIRNILDLCISLNPDYIELANTQYHGWAYKNRKALLPSNEQIINGYNVTKEYQEKYSDIGIYYVIPDYFEKNAKKCMGGWGEQMVTIDPEGNVLPCLSCKILPDFTYENINENTLEHIWKNSSIFNKFRGTDWMTDKQKNRLETEKDNGGCRCQAYMLTGNMYEIDPVCKSSDYHGKFLEDLKNETENELVYRNIKNSNKLS